MGRAHGSWARDGGKGRAATLPSTIFEYLFDERYNGFEAAPWWAEKVLHNLRVGAWKPQTMSVP